MDELIARLRAKVFAGPAEDQRLKLVAEEAADTIERLREALEYLAVTSDDRRAMQLTAAAALTPNTDTTERDGQHG